jgi:Cu(I)-responsive transcriptional regulator
MDDTHQTSKLTIGRLAKAAGVKIDTVRFYERQGLLEKALRSQGGYRLYEPRDIQRLKFIRRAKALGFSLTEIAELLTLAKEGNGRARVKSIAQRRVVDLESRIRELEAMREALAHHVHRCSGRGLVKGCPIIETLLKD